MMLLPAAKGTCPICATEHNSADPHNQQSIYYQYRFYGVRGRWPTWADAIAHCSDSTQEHWKRELTRMGYWSQPADGEPIADPPEESFHQAVGDPNSRTFGPEEEASL